MFRFLDLDISASNELTPTAYSPFKHEKKKKKKKTLKAYIPRPVRDPKMFLFLSASAVKYIGFEKCRP